MNKIFSSALGVAATLLTLAGAYVFADEVSASKQTHAAPAEPQNAQESQNPAPSAPSIPKIAPPVLNAKGVVLRLPYKAKQSDAPLHPSQISLYSGESAFHRGGVVCTDWQGHIYVYDPISPGKGVIKKFDSTGKLVHTFELPPMPFVLSASVTRKGTLWVGMGTEFTPTSELPVLAFRAEDTKPFLDWRVNLPEQLKQVIETPKKQDVTMLEEKVSTYWRFYGIVVGSTKARVYAAYSHSVEDRTSIDLRINVNADEPSEVQVAVTPKTEKITVSILAPDDSQWFVTTGALSWEWENKWFWKEGQPQGEPLIRRKELLDPQSWWQKTFAFKDGEEAPALLLDANSNIYQVWGHQSEGPSRKFYLGDGLLDLFPKASEGEKALVVFNSQRQIIGYLPWTLCYFELFEDWVFPLPDGSGFYRQEYTPKELVVYFYPLPNSKTQVPQ